MTFVWFSYVPIILELRHIHGKFSVGHFFGDQTFSNTSPKNFIFIYLVFSHEVSSQIVIERFITFLCLWVIRMSPKSFIFIYLIFSHGVSSQILIQRFRIFLCLCVIHSVLRLCEVKKEHVAALDTGSYCVFLQRVSLRKFLEIFFFSFTDLFPELISLLEHGRLKNHFK